MEPKNLQLERTVFFCDAVVAIAITLLALDIKIKHVEGHLQFADITSQWKTFLAFFLSFMNIASFWKTHHNFFSHVKDMDETLLWYNVWWLFFIVLLPFSTSLVGMYFFDTAAIFTYSLNTLMISIFQNMIWDYVSLKPKFIKQETVTDSLITQMRLFCNLDMINAILAMIVSFFSPALAFVILVTKLAMIIIIRLFYKNIWTRPKKRGV